MVASTFSTKRNHVRTRVALYSVRSDRMFCEQWDYKILFGWFPDMNLEELVPNCRIRVKSPGHA